MGISIEQYTYSWQQVMSEGNVLAGSFDQEQYKKALLFCYAWLNKEKAFYFQTSGSTGTPKEIAATREQMEISMYSTIEALNLGKEEHFLMCLGIQSIAAAMMLARAIALNAHITVMLPSSDPLASLDDDHPYSCASFVPFQLIPVLGGAAYISKLDRFQTVLVGGASLHRDLERVLATGKARIYHTYGMTETLSHIALRRVGRDRDFHSLKGIEVREDEKHCLCIRGKVTGNKWIVTSDIVRFTGKDAFIILGRNDEVINTGGVKVFPARVEEVLAEALAGIPLFVYGIADKELGQKVIAVIESGKRITPEMLLPIRHSIKDKLTKYETPRSYILADRFHRTASGKIDKRKTLSDLGLL